MGSAAGYSAWLIYVVQPPGAYAGSCGSRHYRVVSAPLALATRVREVVREGRRGVTAQATSWRGNPRGWAPARIERVVCFIGPTDTPTELVFEIAPEVVTVCPCCPF